MSCPPVLLWASDDLFSRTGGSSGRAGLHLRFGLGRRVSLLGDRLSLRHHLSSKLLIRRLRYLDHVPTNTHTTRASTDTTAATECSLLTVPELARIGALAASTVRAYLARGQGDLPDPQAVVGGRPMWSRPVAEDWAEQRSRDPETVQRSVSVAADSDPRGQDGPLGQDGVRHLV